ncbi:MAG: flagellar hook-basal body protein [Spirochaetaceae bacterium]|jgi:flagellar basal-body rod protein FlgG|nr:flagellar hook-basal body protein [Spirochaetaceae bacterium]
MITTYYTGASGMRAQQWRLDAASNNLANVDVNGYKKDITIHKAFPELLLRRMNDDGVYLHPFGSADEAPIIGRLGMGVEYNELFTDFQQGAFKETQSDFDVALDGKGFFAVQTPQGERYTRNGAFVLGKEGLLETKDGFPVLGENGVIRVKANNFQVDKLGNVWVNAKYMDSDELVDRARNEWEDTVLLDTLKIVEFDYDRDLKKQGNSLWKATDISGEAQIIQSENRPRVVQGFVEASNVDPVLEMVNLIEVNRAYEANQKVVQSGDQMLGALINQTARFG